MGWRTVADVRDHSQASGSAYIVLVMLAERAPDETRVAHPGIDLLAKDSRISRATCQRALKQLEEMGEIKAVAYRVGGRGKATEWAIHVKPPQTDTLSERVSSAPQRASSANGKGRKSALKGRTGDTPYIGTEEEPKEPNPPVVPPISLPMVAGVRVDPEHWRLAEEIIGAFNAAAGTAYTLKAHYTPLIGRIREHPELNADDHAAIIAGAFAKPWWPDKPGPGVIYGNAAVFERAIEQRRDKRADDLSLNEAIAARRGGAA